MSERQSLNMLQGPQKAAILMLAMGEKFTSEIFKRINRNEISSIYKAMMKLTTIPKEQADEVIREYYNELIISQKIFSGGEDTVKRMLAKTLDSDTAKYIMDTLDIDTNSKPLQQLNNINPRILTHILRNEHPQTLALILGCLHSKQAAQILINWPIDVQSEVLIRLARLENVSGEILLELDKILQTHINTINIKKGIKMYGLQSVVNILNIMDYATEKKVLSKIKEESSQIANEIRAFMFTFDNIKNLDNSSIRELLKETSSKDLTLALKGASEDLQNKLFSNLSKYTAIMLKNDLDNIGPVKLSDIEEAQQKIVKIIHCLKRKGRILIK